MLYSCTPMATVGFKGLTHMTQKMDWIGLRSVLRPLQHSIGYMGDGFTGQKTQPTVSKY